MAGETIAIACDHAGLDMKAALKEELAAQGCAVLDLGTEGTESVDYPDFADAVAAALKDGRADRGVVVCGTGIGISISANRHPHVRCALVHEPFGAGMARQHNDANVLALGARVTGVDLARAALRTFLETPFEGGRHERRVAKMSPR